MKWNLFLFSIKFTLSNACFQSLSRLELKRTILQAFKVEHFASQKWSGEWVELIQKYRAVTSLWCLTFACITKVSCRRGVFTWEKCRATQKWAIYHWERSSNTEEGETEEEEDEDVEIIYSQRTPYQDEPLAEVDASDNTLDANDIEEGNLMKTGLEQQIWKRDTKRKLLLTYGW